MDSSLNQMRLAISGKAFTDEVTQVNQLLEHIAPVAAFENAIHQRAEEWVRTLRSEGPGHGVEAFLQEYGLDSKEGVAIMCLAEALLRIPDAQTADRLIHSTFEHTEWDRHLGHSDSLMVNASSWGLLLTGKVVNLGQEGASNILGKLVGKFGEPIIREALKKAMRYIGQQFVLGESIEDALKQAKSYAKKGYRFSYDMLGEGARSQAQADFYLASYRHAINCVGEGSTASILEAASVSIKLSALHPRYHLTKLDRVVKELLPRVKELALLAKSKRIAISLDAEEATRLDIQLHLFQALLEDPELADYQGLGYVVQAYQKRAMDAIQFLAALSRHCKKRIPVRLVKGAYWDSEIKWSQINGLRGYPVFTRKEHTDISYMACADTMLSQVDAFYPQFATHNARTIATIEALAKHYGVSSQQYELQRLHGMGESLHNLIVPQVASRIYAPVGAHKDLLAYLIRRLLENGANTSFVNLLMDKDRSLEEIIVNPAKTVQEQGISPNPAIALPVDIYGSERKNSMGIDLGNLAEAQTLRQSLDQHLARPITPPQETIAAEIEGMMKSAQVAQSIWGPLSVQARASLLDKAADAIEQAHDELLALLIAEAKKTIPDGIAEIREAADFCRYYAHLARTTQGELRLPGPTGESNRLSLHPRGVFICISPWNFPLAIFMGQVAAALVTGNSVIAKPAEQTPAIAKRAIEILHSVGIPESVVQLSVGDGPSIGKALVAHPAIGGVVFTGSVETAQAINQTLAQRKGAIVPLIAETGGQNCMVVDSSALLEQAVDDIMLSAFGSAGQRCSALRVLFAQEDIADDLLQLLRGALQEIAIGDPAQFDTDMGPVIDAEAKRGLYAHIAEMERSAKLVARGDISHLPTTAHYVAPHIFEIAHLGALTKEQFGPILHVVRFSAAHRELVADSINATGFGLTFGIHSRIDDNIQFFLSRVHAGNYYVNRSMIGAVVGVQPFGGEGLSGTGPKAGGPHYLTRFVTERTVTINSAAVGGNLELLSAKTV